MVVGSAPIPAVREAAIGRLKSTRSGRSLSPQPVRFQCVRASRSI